MEWKDENIERLVKEINIELKKGRSMKEIELEEFGVNERVIAKRLKRKGYIKKDNQYIISSEKLIQKDNKSINKSMNESITEVKQKDKVALNKIKGNDLSYNELDINKLIELINLIEPIKEVIQEYNKSKNIIDIEPTPQLQPIGVTEVKQKLFKIDVDILNRWDKFVLEHKQFKVQDLVSLALDEFIKKYS